MLRVRVTYDGSRGEHGGIIEIVDDIELEIVSLIPTLVLIAVVPCMFSYTHTMLPEIKGPGNWPFTTTAARVKPSGEMSASEMVRSAVGPTAPATKRAQRRPRAAKVDRDRESPIVLDE